VLRRRAQDRRYREGADLIGEAADLVETRLGQHDAVVFAPDVAGAPGAGAGDVVVDHIVSRREEAARGLCQMPFGVSPGRCEMDPLTRLKDVKLPFAELMGIEFTAAAPERVIAEMAVRPELCTRPAVLHG